MVEWVRPDGREVRRRRHDRAWSPRDLIAAIGDASERATGLRDTRVTPVLLQAIEERYESIPYETLDLIASGFDCDPVDLLAPPLEPGEDDEARDPALEAGRR